MKDEWAASSFIIHPSSFILCEEDTMNEAVIAKIPDLKDRLRLVRSYL
jgi:hypothetical protein